MVYYCKEIEILKLRVKYVILITTIISVHKGNITEILIDEE